MKLFFKLSLSLLILLFVVVIGFIAAFDPNDYKDTISDLVKEKTGRTISIPGDISLSVFPWIGIDLGEIEISNAAGFGKKPFAKMSHLQIRAKLWPLLEQRLEADTLVIENLQLSLSKNKHGVTNWDDLIKPSSKTSTIKNKSKQKKASKTEAATNKSNLLAAFALNGIKIENAQLNWFDQQQNKKISIKNVHLSLGKLKAETKTPFDVSFHYQEKTLDAKMSLKTNIRFTPSFEKFFFYNTKITSDIFPTELKQHLFPEMNSALMELNLKKQTFNTKRLDVSHNNLKLQTKLSVRNLFSTPIINSHLNLLKFNPRIVLNDFKVSSPNTSDKKALTSLQAELDIKGSLQKINLSNIKILLDQTTITGSAKIKSAPHNSSINLLVDTLNIDRYLPTPVANAPKTTPNEAALIPFALLGAFNLDANVELRTLQIKNTRWGKIKLNSHSKNGHIKIQPLNLTGYNSTIKTGFKIDIIKNKASLSGTIHVKDILAGKLVNDFTGKDKLKGKASFNINFSTTGSKVSHLKQNLRGKLKLNLKDGTFKGFDLEHQQRVLRAKLKGKTPPEKPQPEETKIANLDATAVIKKGVLYNNDLRATTPFSRIIGQGTVDIAKEKLNYTASVKFTSSSKIVANTPYEKMSAIPLDIIITGSFDEPKIKADFKKAINQVIDNELKKQKKKYKKEFDNKLNAEKEKATNQLKKKLENELKKLFKF